MRWLYGTADSTDMSLHVRTPGEGEGQGSLECCSPWICKELDTTWQQNIINIEMKNIIKRN